MRRVGQVVRLRPEHEEEYLRLHTEVWPEVTARLSASGITNYSIFMRDGLLFSYFEHVGGDYESDVEAVAADPATQRWWQLTDPCQERMAGESKGPWASMQEVFHLD
ncbi:MAG: L-rhamnose mutarotase [Ornithinimicrobium sp.]